MSLLFLASVKGQLFGFDKQLVAGVGAHKADSDQPLVVGGKKYLRMPDDARALIFEFQALLDDRYRAHQVEQKYYLILQCNGQQVALPIDDRGQWASVSISAALPLPAAFSGESLKLIPSAVINGNDIIFLPDMGVLLEVAEAKMPEDTSILSSMSVSV